jgi:hypothetical protein
MPDLTKILNTLSLVGVATPAFEALFNETVALLSPVDQATAKQAYDDAKVASDEQHARAQAL